MQKNLLRAITKAVMHHCDIDLSPEQRGAVGVIAWQAAEAAAKAIASASNSPVVKAVVEQHKWYVIEWAENGARGTVLGGGWPMAKDDALELAKGGDLPRSVALKEALDHHIANGRVKQ